MKKWLPFLLVLLTCTPVSRFEVEGPWELERLEAQEDYPLYDLNITMDTAFDGVDFLFDTTHVYTLVNETINYVPILGYHFETRWVHTYAWQDTSVWIGVEEWKVIQSDETSMVLENTTVYGIVGKITRTLYFTRK